MKKIFIILFMMIMVSLFMSGCRTYCGYREYTTNSIVGIENEKVRDVSYEISQAESNAFVTLTEVKTIDYIQVEENKTYEEYIYTEVNPIEMVMQKVIFSPFVIVFLGLKPWFGLYSEEVVNYKDNQYIYSTGRKLWNDYNIFGDVNLLVLLSTSDIDGVESDLVDTDISRVPKFKVEHTKISTTTSLVMEVDDKQFDITNKTSLFDACEMVFPNPKLDCSKLVVVRYKNGHKEFLLESNTLFTFGEKINHLSKFDELLEIAKDETATEYDLLLLIPRLEMLAERDYKLYPQLVDLYETDFYDHKNLPDSVFAQKSQKIASYKSLFDKKQEEFRILEEKLLKEEKEMVQFSLDGLLAL